MLSSIIPNIIASVTGHPREIVTPEWVSGSWTHNIFRLFELVVGRRAGIRAEITTILSTEENGRRVESHSFHTFEAVVAFCESYLRHQLRRLMRFEESLGRVRVFIPKLQSAAGFPVPTSPFLFAIAFDAVSVTSGYSQSSGATLAHTTSGSNRALVVTLHGGGATPGTQFTSQAATYNSVSMTKQYTVTAGNRQTNQFTLGAPATGSNNVAVTWSGGGTEARIFAVSYTGVDQTTPCEAQNSSSISSGTSAAISVTTLTNNAWLSGAIFVREGGLGDITCDGTIRSQDQTTGVGDKSTTTAGSNTLTFTIASGAAGSGTTFGAVALKPSAATVVAGLWALLTTA